MGASAGASVGSLLVLVCGLVVSGTGGISSGGAYAPSVAYAGCSPVLPSDLLVLGFPSLDSSAFSSTFGRSMSSSMSSSGASPNCSSGSSSNVAMAMPAGRCEEPPRVVCLVFAIFVKETKMFL